MLRMQDSASAPTQLTSLSQVNAATMVTEVLVLQLQPRRKKKAVRWADGVVDNELMNKKKSKKCCIFHKQRDFGDWSDDEDASGDICHQCGT